MTTILLTSLAEIKSFNPCADGWRNILKAQGHRKENELFPLMACLNSNSISDVCWLLGKREKEISICVNFARKCADSVAHLKNDAAYAYDAAVYAADAAAYYAADYAAADAADASAAAYDAYDAHQKQMELNKQFLMEAIQEYQESN